MHYRHSAYTHSAAMPPRTAPPQPEALLPLRALDVLILTMLAGGDRHGYGIRQDVFDHSRGSIELEAGSMYRNIRRLEDRELIKAGGDPAAGDDPRRIYYSLTPFGRRVLAAEMRRLRELVRLAEARRIIAPARA
jgi:DNA-binding PadR family transcriptional regulator